MSILTDHELEFLARLSTHWPRLYRNELALLLTVRPGEASNTQAHRMAGADRPAERFRGLDAAARVNAPDRMTIVVD
jgi:predicted Zn-dependent protease